ncbi:hypothetical protein PR003_g2789 [Phytophthora rubi]|uniref:Uncharacterized protein n=2 Tax=Phytophthora rubi TaxID=129364 RepID=A0A6A3NIY8_9STRA|nr:hypothetical protein PR002_g4395 [Phytophthora rubi]KAE9355557.1 hypothetical protein PR003_g2789 [Phytophthora rubi]
MQVSACARSVQLALCCFTTSKRSSRDDFKISRGAAARGKAMDFEWGTSASSLSPAAGDDDDGEPGSGDEDVLTSLGASYRAWRAYSREKRAHEYTKTRLVELIKRESALTKQLARLGGTVEGIECALMKLEDLKSAQVVLEGRYDAAVTGQAAREDLALELETVQRQCQLHTDRLHEAEAAASRWKSQYQQALPELACSNLEKERLTGELRKVKKTAVLLLNRQYVQLETMSKASQIPRSTGHLKVETKARSFSNVEII